MQGLAAFIMRGRLYALAVMVAASLIPLFSWASGAVLALVTLRRGLLEGALLTAAGTAVLGVLFGVGFSLPQLALQPALELWLPVLVLGGWLRSTVSLSGTMRLAGGLAVLAVVVLHLTVADRPEYWAQVLGQMDQIFSGGSQEARQAWSSLRERLLPLMAGFVVLIQLIVVLVALLLGRWWQALLFNPGGFRREFHGLDLGRGYGAAAALALGLAAWQGPGLIHDVALVLSGVFVLQALALVHAAAAYKGLSRGWLLALYLLLPFVFELLVVAGVAGAVFGWRRRLQERADPGGGPA